MAQVTLRPSGRSFDVPEGASLLEAGLAAGMSLPYSCRAGHCRSCRAKVVQGQVDHHETSLQYLNEAQRAAGAVLLCKARAVSDLVIEVAELQLEGITPRLVPCRVKRIERPAPDVAIVGLRLPPNQPFKFDAGQFVDVLLAGGKTRSYSIATMPTEEGVVDLELHIRHLPGGLFTDQVFSTLKVGDLLRLRGPLGSFYLREESDKPIIFLASGTGFAPVLSMIQYAQQRGSSRPMALYWGGRAERDLYMAPPALPFVPVLSEQQWSGRMGFVHEAVMQDFPDLSGHQVYACGAPAMVEAARRDFSARCGLLEDAFFADSFLTEADLQ